MSAIVVLSALSCGQAQQGFDSDSDGLSDALEQRLLVQFQPEFLIGTHDCSNVPAEFQRNALLPTALADNGTLYGQAFPVKNAAGKPAIELHYYHLWRTDCGRHGHPLDVEHVSALLEVPAGDPEAPEWRAIYWYAAAHESTVCDVSQIARSSTLYAEHHGPKIWISPDKHASYLVRSSCQAGCGADRCSQMEPLKVLALINLGEKGKPMNGSTFTASPAWPLSDKMHESNFPATALARLNALPANDFAWYNPGRHPAQGIIAISSHTQIHLAQAGTATSSAVNTTDGSTSRSLVAAQDHTGTALGKGYRSVKRALGTSAKHTADALHITDKDEKKRSPKSSAQRIGK